jgi:hypothetical protein
METRRLKIEIDLEIQSDAPKWELHGYITDALHEYYSVIHPDDSLWEDMEVNIKRTTKIEMEDV